jgi:hypothetical protein
MRYRRNCDRKNLMRKLLKFFTATAMTLVFPFSAATASAELGKSGSIRDKSGSTKYRYTTDSSGKTTLRDSSGSTKLTIDKNGTVRNSGGSTQARIAKDGTVRNSSGSTIERRSTDSSGTTTVRDASGSMKYRIMKDGTIRNSSGSTIGKIDKR